MNVLTALLHAHRGAFVALSIGSTVGAIALLAFAPWVLLQLPADHFVRPRRDGGTARRALRLAIGIVLLLLGLAMLVLPGQGVLTMLVGVSLLGLPIERSVARFLLRRPGMAEALNKLRVRAGRAPFVFGEPPVAETDADVAPTRHT